MTAEIIYLAEYRASRVRVRYAVTFDPLVMWRAWAGLWMGGWRK